MESKPYFDLGDTTDGNVVDIVKSLRISYPGTGFSFYLARCRTTAALVTYVRKHRLEKGITFKTAPVAKCYADCNEVLPGILDDARDAVLCEIHVVVTMVTPNHDAIDPDLDICAREVLARRIELRHWRHEIGHAANFAKNAYDNLYLSLPGGRIPPNAEALFGRLIEIPAMVTELLCEAVDNCFLPKFVAPESGFADLFKDGAK